MKNLSLLNNLWNVKRSLFFLKFWILKGRWYFCFFYFLSNHQLLRGPLRSWSSFSAWIFSMMKLNFQWWINIIMIYIKFSLHPKHHLDLWNSYINFIIVINILSMACKPYTMLSQTNTKVCSLSLARAALLSALPAYYQYFNFSLRMGVSHRMIII